MPIQIGNQGNLVRFFQTVLKNIGTYSGEIDGIFGVNTEQAIKDFQRQLNLDETGIITEELIEELLPYITVLIDLPYTSEITEIVINSLIYKYRFLEKSSIGTSVLGKDITAIKIGNGDKNILYVGSTHANEWITTPLLLKFIEDFSLAYTNGEDIYGRNSRELFNRATIHIVPLHNPDGVDLVNGDINTESDAYLNALQISNNYPSIPFPSGWKANIEGIDLNLQFPAEWQMAKEIKFSQGFVSPAPRDYVGEYPLQSPEAISLYDYTISNDFLLMITFHTQGQVIFWKFLDYTPPNAETIGNELSKASGYALAETPYVSSFAGFKDWFIQNYNRPGYTLEAGIGQNPLPISQFNEIYEDVLGVMVLGAALI